MKGYSLFVGIDISKAKLDVSLLARNQVIATEIVVNAPEKILAWYKNILQLPGFNRRNTLFCMEHTGIYGNHLLECLGKHKANVVLENPIHIKRSLGLVREKNDRVDASRIANFASKNQFELVLWTPRRPVIDKLAQLATLRNRLLNVSGILKTPGKDQDIFLSKNARQSQQRLIKKSVSSVSDDLEKIGHEIKKTIYEDPELRHISDLLLSVPGIGSLTSLYMIITTNEFRWISCPKKFACYAGLAPFKQVSGGQIRRAKVSGFANKRMKCYLHMAAMAAIRTDEEIRQYYLRKTKVDKKPKMLVINAVRNKLVLRAFACIKQNRRYSSDYQNQTDSLPVTLPPAETQGDGLDENSLEQHPVS